MRSFSWSSVFWINVPLLVAAFIGALHLIPDSRDPHATRLDPVGAGLSIAAISTLVYAIIQAPERGWTSTSSVVNFAIGAAIAVVFVGWEMHRDDPMLDMSLFRNRSFSAGSIALALLFFAMAGTVFLQAQYLQFVLEYTPLAAGFALVPAAIGMLLGTGAGAHLAEMHGGRIAVTAGTLIATSGVAVQAAFVDGGSYLPTGVGLLLFGLGAGIAMPPATEMIMATLPPARAGVGSAVNDTVREFGGALGVAVIGSIAATSYATSMRSELDQFPNLTGTDRSMLVNNVGAAIHTSPHLGDQADQIAAAARTAFVDSMHSSLWIAAGLAFCAAVVTFTQLPREGGQGAHGVDAHARHHAGHHPHLAVAEAAARTDASAS
jgi:MFS family permease